MCKAYRTLCPTATEKNWFDTIFPCQGIVIYDGERCAIHLPGNNYLEPLSCGTGPIVSGFPYGARSVTMQQLIYELGVERKLPTLARIKAYKPPYKLVRPSTGVTTSLPHRCVHMKSLSARGHRLVDLVSRVVGQSDRK